MVLRLWRWLLPLCLFLGAGKVLAHPVVGQVRVKIYVSNTEWWCCGRNWWGSCDCGRQEAYNLVVNGFNREWQVAGTFYGGRWYEATFGGLSQDWPTFRNNLANVRFFNTDRNWVVGHTAVTVWDTGGNIIRDHDTDVGDYWVGPWNNFWFNSVLWNYNYNTPHDSYLWNNGADVAMNWNAGNAWVNQITMVDPDGCYPGFSTSSSNPGLGSVNVYQAGCSGKHSYYNVHFQPAANAFGRTLVTVNINDGAINRSHSFWVNVNRVGAAPTIPAIRQNDLVRAEHTVTLVNAIQVNDEYTPLQNLTVQAISTSSDAIPLSRVAITAGSGGNAFRNVTITTPNNVAPASGTVTLGIRVTDSDGQTASGNLAVRYQENVRY